VAGDEHRARAENGGPCLGVLGLKRDVDRHLPRAAFRPKVASVVQAKSECHKEMTVGAAPREIERLIALRMDQQA
jgi:hypothetical protein